MKGYRTKRIIGLALLTLIAGALVLALPTAARAQRSGNPIEIYNARREGERIEALRKRELENVRNATRAKVPVDPRRKNALVARVREDFNAIQVLNNEMIRVAFAAEGLNYDSLYEKAGEMRKRATRLRETIKFPEDEGEDRESRGQENFDDIRLKTSVLVLRNMVKSFVTNPLFQQSGGTLDVQLSARANRDLRGIAILSDAIRKNARRLDKR
ncbi:MAG TPA: hypothetical protein VN256_14045 [Pyrinomonadaceae bacterium]|nr:hypothetical protein [Pyrinomonadaceae bacterium]